MVTYHGEHTLGAACAMLFATGFIVHDINASISFLTYCQFSTKSKYQAFCSALIQFDYSKHSSFYVHTCLLFWWSNWVLLWSDSFRQIIHCLTHVLACFLLIELASAFIRLNQANHSLFYACACLHIFWSIQAVLQSDLIYYAYLLCTVSLPWFDQENQLYLFRVLSINQLAQR